MRVEIIPDATRRPLHQIQHEGRRYVAAPPDGDYAIRLTNTTGARQLAVVSVDGVNVVNNEDAAPSGPGYVLRAHETVVIPGWRRDDGEVARFTFGGKGGSYTAQTGRGVRNNGAIGVAVFNEKVRDWYGAFRGMPLSYDTDETKMGHGGAAMMGSGGVHLDAAIEAASGLAPTCSVVPTSARTVIKRANRTPAVKKGGKGTVQRKKASKRVEGSDLGTGYGERATFRTTATDFEPATEAPIEVHELIYATRERLIELDVPVDREERLPSAFPAAEPACPPPPGWEG